MVVGSSLAVDTDIRLDPFKFDFLKIRYLCAARRLYLLSAMPEAFKVVLRIGKVANALRLLQSWHARPDDASGGGCLEQVTWAELRYTLALPAFCKFRHTHEHPRKPWLLCGDMMSNYAA